MKAGEQDDVRAAINYMAGKYRKLDKLIPVEKAEEIYSGLPEPKELVKIEGADHFFTGKLNELAGAVRGLTEEYLIA
ncbi:hypothetical protein [Candidatus Methanoperedens nitratireducens]|nr:hypothetical protein [Candidatus Methanoperedens nitroreducens]